MTGREKKSGGKEMEQLLEEIAKITLQDDKSLLERMVKLQEEAGELAQEVLIESKTVGSRHKSKGIDGIQGEAIDVVLVALSIYFQDSGTIEFLKKLLKEKCEKWQRVRDLSQKT